MATEFNVTSEHLKLIQRLCVGWQDCEYGAPEIDPKRPYGNSGVEPDILEILEVPLPKGDDGYTDQQRVYAARLHKDMEPCLEILLHNLSITVGKYVVRNGKWATA